MKSAKRTVRAAEREIKQADRVLNDAPAMVAEQPSMRLADLEQTKQVLLVRTTVANSPLMSLGAFVGLPADNDEAERFWRLGDRAYTDACALLATWEGHKEHVQRLQALRAALDQGGGESPLEGLTQTLLALGVAYGVRLATTAREGGTR